MKATRSVAAYAPAKAGLLAFSRCVAAEYGWQGVRWGTVIPSWAETPMRQGLLEDEESRAVVGRHALQRSHSPKKWRR